MSSQPVFKTPRTLWQRSRTGKRAHGRSPTSSGCSSETLRRSAALRLHNKDGQGSATLGAAVWFQPGQVLTLGRQLKLTPELAKTFFAAPASFVRFARLGGTLAERRPDEPHAYLAALGVSPTFSGQGVGSALVQAGTVQADRARQRCYLETFSEPNVHFYKRHGFSVTGQGDDLIPGGPPFWFMTRPPGQA